MNFLPFLDPIQSNPIRSSRFFYIICHYVIHTADNKAHTHMIVNDVNYTCLFFVFSFYLTISQRKCKTIWMVHRWAVEETRNTHGSKLNSSENYYWLRSRDDFFRMARLKHIYIHIQQFIKYCNNVKINKAFDMLA